MIIACPECTSPFQVLDGQIAALLQIECPTCTFRMILDFQAANDSSLREAGMGMAQGFRDEAAYRQAVGAGEISYAPTEARPAAQKPDLRAVPTPEPERRPASTPATTGTPAPTTTPAPTATPVQAQPQAEPARGKPPVRARPTLIAHTAPPPVRPELTPPPQRTVDVQAEAAVDTHVGPPPRDEIAAPVEVEPPDSARLEVPADEFSVDLDDSEEPDVVPASSVLSGRPRPAIEAEPVRTPPHSPSPPPSGTRASDDQPTPSDTPTIEPKPPEPTKPAETGKRKGGALRTALLMFLLLILMGAAGLMGWSVIETQNPNPLPMLKAKFGIDLGFGVPADAGEAGDEKVEPPPAGDAADGNASGQ